MVCTSHVLENTLIIQTVTIQQLPTTALLLQLIFITFDLNYRRCHLQLSHSLPLRPIVRLLLCGRERRCTFDLSSKNFSVDVPALLVLPNSCYLQQFNSRDLFNYSKKLYSQIYILMLKIRAKMNFIRTTSCMMCMI